MCINQVFDLLAKGDTRCAAVALVVVAFVLGAVIGALLTKLAARGGKKSTCACKSRTAESGRRGDAPGANRKAERPAKFERRHPAPADGSVEIYVGNLSYDTTEAALRTAFEAFGKVNGVRLITNRYTGKSKGFGFVQMPNRAEAEAAIAALNDKDVDGRKMKCNEARNLA
ncbi:MAG TPA: hypothetical protein DDY72_01850 [Verrucomicrobia bacterium]|nr:hypothetical protein [Verrucomicrobiota bacterium]